jgi:hypothetical protein
MRLSTGSSTGGGCHILSKERRLCVLSEEITLRATTFSGKTGKSCNQGRYSDAVVESSSYMMASYARISTDTSVEHAVSITIGVQEKLSEYYQYY